jgi:hypothetical protein
MKLADLQGAYRYYLLTGESERLAPAIVADAFDGAERIAIYRNNFLIGLGEALKANFPVTLQLLGHAFFEQAAHRFILAHPPRSPCLFEYGTEFPGYLRDLPELSALPYIADVARFELARIASYNASIERYLTAEILGSLPPDELDALSIRMARHVQVVPVTAPVQDLWQAHQAPEPDLSAIDMTSRPHVLLVCRPDRTLVIQELDAAAVRFLSAAREEIALGSAAAQSGAQDDAALGRTIALALALKLVTTPAVPYGDVGSLSAPA